MNNNTPHLKSPKNQNRRVALGRPAMKLLGVGGWLELVCGKTSQEKKKEKKENNHEETKQKCRLGTASNEIIGGFN